MLNYIHVVNCFFLSAVRNIHPCPKYANHGCFTSILRHEENDEAYDDVIRGCSTFSQEYACSGWTERELDGNGNPTGDQIEWNSCKETCEGANCNNKKAEIAGDNRCYVCTAQVDSHGDSVGVGNDYCFNNEMTGDEVAIDCGRDEYCITDMEVDWLPMGDQVTTIRRRCGTVDIIPGCVTTITNSFAAKDCYSTCQGTLCNDNLDVADMLTEDVVTECYNCKFNEITGSNHEDIEQCKESPIEETKMSCPRWARAACFVADAVIQDDDYRHEGTDLVTIYRGCSSFSEDLFGSMMKCSTITVDVGVDTDQPDRRTASICKQLCSESDDCNNIRYPDFQPPEECPPCDEPTTTEALQTTEEPTEEPATEAPESSTSTTTTTTTTASAAIESLLLVLLFTVLMA